MLRRYAPDAPDMRVIELRLQQYVGRLAEVTRHFDVLAQHDDGVAHAQTDADDAAARVLVLPSVRHLDLHHHHEVVVAVSIHTFLVRHTCK